MFSGKDDTSKGLPGGNNLPVACAPILFKKLIIFRFNFRFTEKSQRDFPFILHPASPNINIICNNHGTSVEAEKLMLVPCYSTNPHFLQGHQFFC